MKADCEIGLVPPLAYFASGRNYPINRMMKSEWLPLPDPCSHIYVYVQTELIPLKTLT